MSPERWRKINELFEAAAACAPGSRANYIDERCGSDVEMRDEVQRLLANDARAAEFLTPPSRSELLSAPDTASVVTAGTRIGAYQLSRQLAAGGMGSVWLAERADDQFRSRVAVKLLHRDIDSADILQRFRQERQVLANLQHPNISRLLDGGLTADGRPYLIMEYIDGLPIDRYCDQHRLAIADRLELFRKVCSAVQYAHQNLVVHRDLKPGNILVGDNGVPTLLDFGIAKLLGPNNVSHALDMTATGRRFMTPAYASPEQIRGQPITTATDTYSLGVILYELLSGQKPYRLRDDTLTDFERAICEEQPQPPSEALVAIEHTTEALIREAAHLRCSEPASLRRQLRGDLDTIVLMALRKEPDRRYATVEQFSEDIARYTRGLPVVARPDTIRYRSVKFVRRNRLAVAFATTVFALLLALTIATRVQSARIAEESRRADERYRQMKQTAEFQAAMLGGIDAEQMGRTIVGELRKQVEAGMKFRLASAGSHAAPDSRALANALRQFDEALAPGNATDVARQMMDASILKPAVAAVEREFDGQPEVAATLYCTIGNVYRALGMFPAAEPEFRKALALQRSLPGDHRRELAVTLNDLSLLLQDEGKYDAAEPLARESLDIRRQLFGNENSAVAQSLSNLGLILVKSGDLNGAEPLMRDALAIRRKLEGDESGGVAQSLQNLAGLLMSKKDAAAAEPLFREVLKIQRKLYGNDNATVALSLNNLAGALLEKGDAAAAAPVLREALEIHTKTQGAEHPKTLSAMHNLAGLYMTLGQFADAEPLARQALNGLVAQLPPGHPQLGISRLSLALILHGLNRDDEAQSLLAAQDWDTFIKNPNISPEIKTRARVRLTSLYEAWGKPDEAATWRARSAESK